MARKERHVVPDQQGGWDAKKPHAERASAHCDTKAQAVDRARDICTNQIVSRRGHVVPLEKGKEGIHKKFDEVLSSACDC
ncbi:MAG: DUF2188 domain-containing protein [Methanothrix sp.]